MAILLKRFMELAYTLHVMGIELDIDEVGLEVEQFAVIDAHFRDYLGDTDACDLEAELVEIVNALSQIKPKGDAEIE